MRDDAVAPVIGVMLILAALVTFLAVFNGIYIPSLKQSAEIDHIGHVEEAFYRFSSDLSFAVTSGKDGLSFTEPVQMGGGDVVFNPLKSGGSLAVRAEEEPVYTLNFTTDRGTVTLNGTLVSVSYEPQGNFWQDQGYRWQYGYLNVTKYGSRTSPLAYDTVDDVREALGNQTTPAASFARSFAGTGYERNQTLVPVYNNATNTSEITAFGPLAGTCSEIELRAVRLSADPAHTFASSNGYGTITLTTVVNRTSYGNVTGFSVAAGTAGSGPDAAFRNATLQGWRTAFATLTATTACKDNLIPVETGDGPIQYNLSFPVNITVEQREIRVGVS